MSINIARVFANTAQSYLTSCLAQRQPGVQGTGSRFINPVALEDLTKASWEPYSHPEVMPPALAFRANIPGHIGIVPLDSLARDTYVTLRDRKGTGFLEAEYPMPMGPRVEHTTLLVGPDQDDESKLVVWTFFPGDPVMPSRLTVSEQYKDGMTLTVDAAIASGMSFAKAVEQ